MRNDSLPYAVKKGGGTKSEEVMRSSTYAQIMDKLLQHFFPGGKSMIGKISKLNLYIGDGRGNIILKDNFSLETTCIGKDNRLNLMTKEKTPSITSIVSTPVATTHVEQHNVTALMSMIQTPPGHVNTGTPTVTFNPDSLKCCVCYECERKAFLIPCGHQYCMECAVQLNSTSAVCALCRAGISGVGKLQYT